MRRLNILILLLSIGLISPADGRQVVDLTLRRAVEIAMDNSYRIKQLRLGIERTRYWLKAERAGLKSKFYMNLIAPDIQRISDYKWDSNLGKDVIVRQNTQRIQMNFSIRQPVVFLGYPTNGYLSLNNQIYRYVQTDGIRDVSFYNRYFIKFEQPFFQPNILKNAIEDAELDLERSELEYIDDQVDFFGEIAEYYFDMFELAYKNVLYSQHIELLTQFASLVQRRIAADPSKKIEENQITIERANTQENYLTNLSKLRIKTAEMRQVLRMHNNDTLMVSPEIDIKEIKIDVQQAIQSGLTLHPRIQMLNITRRKDEIDLQNTRGWNSFRVDLEMTYGIEKEDERYRRLWHETNMSNSITLNAYIPLWDWGQRRARIEAEKISLLKTELYIEERQTQVESEIRTAVTNLEEYQKRAISMRQNMEMSQQVTLHSKDDYRDGKITLQDFMQTLARQKETEVNFLNAYLGYRKSLITLMEKTYYDYETSTALLDQFKID